jgi:SNF2 family DNA or RNA helicase
VLVVNLFALLLLLLQVQQAEDRAHRIGQTQSVNVHLLLVKDSIDDLMWELLQSKLATTGQVLDGHATRMEVRSKGVGRGEEGQQLQGGRCRRHS